MTHIYVKGLFIFLLGYEVLGNCFPVVAKAENMTDIIDARIGLKSLDLFEKKRSWSQPDCFGCFKSD